MPPDMQMAASATDAATATENQLTDQNRRRTLAKGQRH